MSVCSGAFVPARRDYLTVGTARRTDAHRTTQGPASAGDHRPDGPVREDGLVLTSAGTAAGIDLCLHILRQRYGDEVAGIVARRMVVPPHRDGGQAQYIEDPLPEAPVSPRPA